MTKEEVKALIKAKIEGQGSAIDAASVLPAILNGIMDLIDGGGGSASDAVKYTEQTLTEAQQMQARKNQGLYYSEGSSEDVTLTWDGDTTGLESVEFGQGTVMYKVSDDAPQKESIKSLGTTVGGVEHIMEVPQQYIIPIEGGYAIGDGYIIVATESEASLNDYTFTKGVWFGKGNNGGYISKFTYEATETVHQIPSEYLPITTSLSASSTDEVVPSAKTVYNYIINNPPSGTLRYDAAQSLNNTQKNQAIQNLGIENKIGSFMTIDQDALENIWFANMSYDKMYSIIRGGGNIAAYVSKNIEEIVDGFPEYIPIVIGTFSGEIIGERNAWPREDKIVFSNVIYGESSLEINTITFLPSSDSTPSGTFAKYTFNATKTTTP